MILRDSIANGRSENVGFAAKALRPAGMTAVFEVTGRRQAFADFCYGSSPQRPTARHGQALRCWPARARRPAWVRWPTSPR
jgi:hypothetical protein